MSPQRLLVLAGALLAAAVLAASSSAQAAGTAQLTEARGTAFPAKAFVLTLPRQQALRPGDVRVTEGGAPVDGLRIEPGDAAGARTFGAVLVIDTSESMRGAPIAAAMTAARQFAARRPAQQRLGVVFFNHDATLALAPTTDARRIDAVLAAPPPLARGTRIYDAAAVGLRALSAARVSAGSLVVLSDGADVGSVLSPAATAAAARATKTRVFTVGLRSRSYDSSTLQGLAAATRGRYAEAGPRTLAPLFAALGRRFGREYLVTYRSLSPLSASVVVRAVVAGVPGAAQAGYRTPAPPAAAGPAHRAAATSAHGLVLAAILAALLLGVAARALLRLPARSVGARIADFTGSAPAGGPELDGGFALERRRGARMRFRHWVAYAEDVSVAGIGLAPEALAGRVAAATALACAAAVALGNAALAVILLAAPVVARLVVAARANGARREFGSQLADNLQVIASAMRAGQSFTGALAVAVEDAAEPARRELARAVADDRLGVALDEALARVARRMRSDELEYVGLVATLQRETGGKTAEVLERVTETIRERAELKRLVRTLTAQGRLGGGVVSALPLALAAIFLVIRPHYFDPLVDNAAGIAAIVLGGLMLATGWIVIRRIVDIKV
ncbi:MAG: type II secretion system F family protein [Solirubrobacteraceae bacterium]